MINALEVFRSFRKSKAEAPSTRALQARISNIVRPPVAELEAKRNARFGRLNVAPSFRLTSHICASEMRGDVRQEFARRIAAGAF